LLGGWASQGTGKEYIGDDATSMAEAVQQALRQCALQLKTKLARAQAVKDRKERKKVLYRYIPDVTRAIFGVLNDAVDRGRTTAASVAAAKRLRGEPEPAEPVDEVRPSATASRLCLLPPVHPFTSSSVGSSSSLSRQRMATHAEAFLFDPAR